MIAEEIAILADELQAREETVPAGFKWPREEAVDPNLALRLLSSSSLERFVPLAGENVGFEPNDYYGDAEYLMPPRPLAAAVIAESRGPYPDGSQLWHLGVILRTDWGYVKVSAEVSRGRDGKIRPAPYVYDRVYVQAYAETGYEDGTPREKGVYSVEEAREILRIVSSLLERSS